MKQKPKSRITLTTVGHKLDALAEVTGGLVAKTDGLVEKTDDIIEAIQTLASDTDQRFDRVERRMENRFNNVDNDLREMKRFKVNLHPAQ